MMRLFDVDWKSLFVPQTPILEIFIRGSIIYLGLFILLRVILKREAGTLGITDLLVVVLIAEASQNALTGGYKSIPEGIFLVLTIILWSYLINWLGFRYPAIQRFIHPKPLPLIKNGKILIYNLKKELLTKEELMTQLREQGVTSEIEVKEAFMEADGRISVITFSGNNQNNGVTKKIV